MVAIITPTNNGINGFKVICDECRWEIGMYTSAGRECHRVMNEHNWAQHPADTFVPAIMSVPDLPDFYAINLEQFQEAQHFVIQPRGAGKTAHDNEELQKRVKALESLNTELRTQLKMYMSANYGKPAIDGLRIKDALIKQLQLDLKHEMKRVDDMHDTNCIISRDNNRLEREAMAQAEYLNNIQAERAKQDAELERLATKCRNLEERLDKTPAIPECKDGESHNFVNLDVMFVFCNRCGESIHYKRGE